jgi:HEAT repeat protein
MEKFSFKVGASLLVLVYLGLTTPVGLADVYFLPRTKEELDSLTNKSNASKVDPMVHVEGAKIAYFNRPAMERDFPFLKGKTDSEIEAWILKNCAYISKAQLELNGIRQSEIPTSEEGKKDGFRPLAWNRAAVIPVSEMDDRTHAGLIDIKGAGLHADSNLIKTQLSKFKDLHRKNDLDGINQLRVKDHSDGLATLGEGIAEVVRSEALQKSFDQYNEQHKTDYQTVEHYFVISLPFTILKEGETSDPAALIGRQAHVGRHKLGASIPDELYVDFFGGKQSDFLGAVVDMGGVFPTAPEFQEKFLTDKQIKAISNPSLSRDKMRKIFDPQKSREWEYAHQTAQAFLKGEAEKRAVYNHLQTMVGNRRASEHKRSLADRLKTMFEAPDPTLRNTAASTLYSYQGPDAPLVFEKAFEAKDSMVRNTAASALGSYQGPDAPFVFEKAFETKDPMVRNTAASALYSYQGPDAHLIFEKAFEAKDSIVRVAAVSALTSYKGVVAHLVFEKAFANQDPEVRKRAASAFSSYQGPDAPLVFEKAFEAKDPEVRRIAASALRSYKGADAHLVFEKVFADADPQVRRAAASALRNYKGADAPLAFEKAFEAKDPMVRNTAASAFDYYQGPDAHLVFEKAFEAKDPEVRVAAAFALTSYKGADAQVFFGKALTDEKLNVRRTTRNALKQSGMKIALPLLVRLLTNENFAVRQEICDLIKTLYPEVRGMGSEKINHLRTYMNTHCEKPIDQVLKPESLSEILEYLETQSAQKHPD